MQNVSQGDIAYNEFKEKYIGSPEIAERIGVSRVAVLYARTSGKLPGGFEFGRLYVWERKAIEPHLVAWEQRIAARRAGEAHNAA